VGASSGPIVVRFSANGSPSGHQNATLNIESNSNGNCTFGLSGFRKHGVIDVRCDGNCTNSTSLCGSLNSPTPASEAAGTNFGSAQVNASTIVRKTFKIRNTGTTDLTLSNSSGPVVEISDPSFVLVTSVANPTVLAPDETLDVVIEHSFGIRGQQTAIVQIHSDVTDTPCAFELTAVSVFFDIYDPFYVSPTNFSTWVMYLPQTIQWTHNLDPDHTVSLRLYMVNEAGVDMGMTPVTVGVHPVTTSTAFWPPHRVLSRNWFQIEPTTYHPTLNQFNETVWPRSGRFFLKTTVDQTAP